MAMPTIDEAFITKFNRDVHLDYQQRQSLLRGTVRTDADVRASKVRFQRLGQISTGTKARQGEIPPSNPQHSWVECPMEDKYTLDFVDQLDLGKLNIEIRANYVEIHSAAFGRDTDDMIVAAMEAGSTQFVGDHSGQLTRNSVLEWIEKLDVNYVPDDMRRYAVISPRGFSHLMCVPEFANGDYVGPDLPFVRRAEVRTWLGVHWIKFNRLPGAGTANAKFYLYHSSAVGHGISAEVSLTWDWENTRKAWSVAGSMSMGAVVIDPAGIIEGRFDDTAALPA